MLCECIKIRCLEIHISHACNLSCDYCSHYSNFKFKGNLSKDDFCKSCSLWNKKIFPEDFNVMGGEPSINPELCEILISSRLFWPFSRINLISNGFFLHKHEKLPEILEKYKIKLEISLHENNEDYFNKTNINLINNWRKEYNFEFKIRESYKNWQKLYKIENGLIKPFVDNNPKESWNNCPSKYAVQLHEQKLWKCPRLAYLKMLKMQKALVPEWNPYLAYQPLNYTASYKEIKKFLLKEEEFYCNMCPAKPDNIHDIKVYQINIK